MSEQSLGDLIDKPIEEIEKMLDHPESIQPVPEPEPVAVPEPAEPVAAEPVKEPAPEPVPEETQEDLDKQILLARLEASEAANKKMEARLAGREAGEKGYIKQLQDRLKALETKRTDPEEPRYAEPDAEEPERRTPAAPSRDSVAAWAVGQAIQGAFAGFASGHPDYQEVVEDVKGYLEKSGYDSSRVLMADDPIEAAKEVTRALDEAYWHVKADRKSKAVADLTQRKADQVRSLSEAKLKATMSGSGAPPVPPPKTKSVQDMTADEAEKELDRLLRMK